MWSLDKVHKAGELAAAIAVVISLIFVGLEVRDNTVASEAGRNDRTESITTAPLQQQRHRNSRLNFIVIRRVVHQPCARPSLTDTSFRLRTGLINRATGTASNPFEKIDLCLIKCAPRRCKSLHARAHLGGITRFGRLKKLSFELLDDQPLEV